MKTRILSAVIILMSSTVFALTSQQPSSEEAFKALLKVPSTTMVQVIDGSHVQLGTILDPLKSDLADFIATGLSLGDDGSGSKLIRTASLRCESLRETLAYCHLEMDRTSGIGTTLDFNVDVARDGSMKVVGFIQAQNDL